MLGCHKQTAGCELHHRQPAHTSTSGEYLVLLPIITQPVRVCAQGDWAVWGLAVNEMSGEAPAHTDVSGVKPSLTSLCVLVPHLMPSPLHQHTLHQGVCSCTSLHTFIFHFFTSPHSFPSLFKCNACLSSFPPHLFSLHTAE